MNWLWQNRVTCWTNLSNCGDVPLLYKLPNQNSDALVAKGNSGDMVTKVKIESIRSEALTTMRWTFNDYGKLDNHDGRNIKMNLTIQVVWK